MSKQATAASEPADIQRYLVQLKQKRGGPHGYVTLLGLKNSDSLTLLTRVRTGLAFSAFERFQRNISLPTEELAGFVQISVRTLARRRLSGRFNLEESDRLVRASRVFGLALGLFEGDAEAARRWLSKKAPALGGRTPLEVANTDVGSREVEGLIGRLEHGVFA